MAHSIRRFVLIVLALGLTVAAARVVIAGEDHKINVNTASIQQLTTIRGIGEVTAKAIVAYREEHGPFKTVDELVNVKGIGPKSLSNIREQITADGGGVQVKAK